MLSIRLSRVGKKKRPIYRVIVIPKERDPYGVYLENLGTYNPLTKPKELKVDAERVKHWLKNGAEASDTVWNLLISHKIIEGEKRKIKIGKKKAKK